MKNLILLLIILGFFPHIYGQSACELQKKADSAALISFSQGLKVAVMSSDMHKIAAFFQFPFRQGYCQADSKRGDSLISEKDFKAASYNNFFGVWFMETVSKGYVYYLLDCDEKDGHSRLVFNYPNTFAYRKSSCSKMYFSIEKIKGRYKITSSWVLP